MKIDKDFLPLEHINVLIDVRINVQIMSELSIVSSVSNNNETGKTIFETT